MNLPKWSYQTEIMAYFEATDNLHFPMSFPQQHVTRTGIKHLSWDFEFVLHNDTDL